MSVDDRPDYPLVVGRSARLGNPELGTRGRIVFLPLQFETAPKADDPPEAGWMSPAVLVLLGLSFVHFGVMAYVTGAALEMSWELRPHVSLAASLLICLVPTIGYAVAAYLAVSCLKWPVLGGIALFAGPSLLWTAAMWNCNRQRHARRKPL